MKPNFTKAKPTPIYFDDEAQKQNKQKFRTRFSRKFTKGRLRQSYTSSSSFNKEKQINEKGIDLEEAKEQHCNWATTLFEIEIGWPIEYPARQQKQKLTIRTWKKKIWITFTQTKTIQKKQNYTAKMKFLEKTRTISKTVKGISGSTETLAVFQRKQPNPKPFHISLIRQYNHGEKTFFFMVKRKKEKHDENLQQKLIKV